MPLDPKVRAQLEQLAALNEPPLAALPAVVARERSIRNLADIGVPSVDVAAVNDRSIPGPGGPLTVRIYMPEGTGPFPLLMFFHGGGFVVCSIDTHDRVCRALCRDAACVVVSVDYRMAPESIFPAASDDCVAATRWAVEHAAEFNADATRMAVAGDSAGGNLAATTALRIRDEGGPLRGEYLIYPVTDHYDPGTPSYQEFSSGYGLSREDMAWFWDHYLPGGSIEATAYAAPLRASDLSGLPPTLLISAEYDVLRDEGERYAERLREAGVPLQFTRYEGVNHGFVTQLGLIDQAQSAIDEASAWLRGVFAPTERTIPS